MFSTVIYLELHLNSSTNLLLNCQSLSWQHLPKKHNLSVHYLCQILRRDSFSPYKAHRQTDLCFVGEITVFYMLSISSLSVNQPLVSVSDQLVPTGHRCIILAEFTGDKLSFHSYHLHTSSSYLVSCAGEVSTRLTRPTGVSLEPHLTISAFVATRYLLYSTCA